MEEIENVKFDNWETETETKKFSLIPFGIILAAGLILSASACAYSFYKIKMAENVLSVTGSAKKEVISDKVRWSTNISRIVKLSQLKSGYEQMDKDLQLVKTFLAEQNIPSDQITISPVFMNQNYDYEPNNANKEKEYTLLQNIDIQSSDVVKISDIAKKTSDLINKGVIFATNSLEYYYSKLPETRVELLTEATNDAKVRAGKLAESSGKKVGLLKSASSGVVQVLSKNSMEVSDSGSYSTSGIEKEIMVTVKATFNLK